MKEYKQYLLRGRDNQEAVAVLEIPSKFDMTRICENFGEVTKVSVGIYREDPTYEYQFSSSKGLSNVNTINRLELSLHSVKENHLFTQPLTVEEITESFFETTVEFGVSVFKISSYKYGGGRTHEFDANEYLLPKSSRWVRFVTWFNS